MQDELEVTQDICEPFQALYPRSCLNGHHKSQGAAQSVFSKLARVSRRPAAWTWRSCSFAVAVTVPSPHRTAWGRAQVRLVSPVKFALARSFPFAIGDTPHCERCLGPWRPL
jgi:hypothetical protein